MVLGTPANALSWFSRLLSGSAHDYLVSNINKILEETQTIQEAVQAAAGLLDPFFADPDAETRSIERFWKTHQEIANLVYFTWIGRLPAPISQKTPSVKLNRQERSSEPYVRD